MAFWHWKKEPTLAEQAVSAVDRISQDIDELRSEREMTLSCFRCAADSLRDINQELGLKSALCGTLIAQLQREQTGIAQQVSDNEKVRAKILDIIGE